MNRFFFSLLLLCGPAFCQSSQPAFEVASVKLVEEMRGQLVDFSSSGPRVRYTGFPTVQLIREAYNLKNYEMAFAPGVDPPTGGAYGTAFYDIDAKAEGDRPRTRDEFRAMLRILLA